MTKFLFNFLCLEQIANNPYLITSHTPNYSHTLERGLGFRYVSNKIQQKPSKLFQSESFA